MKAKHVLRTFLVLVALVAAVLFNPLIAKAAGGGATFTFSDDGIAAVAPADSYTIKEGTNNLSITAEGTYTITGSCSEGSVSVKGTGITLILDNLTLTSATTAPIAVKKASDVTIHLEGDSVLYNNEADPENGEGACIKVKGTSLVTFCGEGNLTCFANSKNGIKGGAESVLTFNQSGTITVKGNAPAYAYNNEAIGAVNNGIAADGAVIINNGTFNIYAANDGIKSDPDVYDPNDPESATDTASDGTVTINGGTINIWCDGDGIHADTVLTVNGGAIAIQTMQGYNTSGGKYTSKTDGFGPSQGTTTPGIFVDDEMSAKGLKAGGDRAEDQGLDIAIVIKGGTFGINSVDDAIHSDGAVTITGGTFQIGTGDDGVHAETTLTLGTSTAGNSFDRNPDISILASYEGLEGLKVDIYSGRYSIKAKDDGINAAGGSSQGSDPFTPGGDWRPGGGFPGFPGGGGNTSQYSINVYGGTVYVVCDGDGLDSNGSLNLYGGALGIFSMSSGDNSALDADGGVTVNGAYVFTAGAQGVGGSARSNWFGSNQKYKTLSGNYAANTVFNAYAGNTLLSSVVLPKRATYIMFSAPGLSTTPTISQGSFTYCKGGSFTHTWDEGVVTVEPTEESTGLMTYTCTKCGATETQVIPALVHIDECDHGVAAAGFVGTFAIQGGTVDVYYTQDYTEPSETNVFTTLARSKTGEIDESGDGQINFTVNLEDGYSITNITIDGGYKNCKDISDEAGVPNTYRITKVTSDLLITIETLLCNHPSLTAGDITWAWETGAATASFHCDDCGGDFALPADVASVYDGSMLTLTATLKLGENTFTDTITTAPFTATFAGDEGVESFDVYYAKDNTTADETDAATAIARDSKTGAPVVNGDGQINFLVNLKDGYAITEVKATKGSYKNIKDSADTGVENMYRITKVVADMTITVTTAQVIDIFGATVTAPTQGFTGEAIEPEVTVTLDGNVIEAANYDVVFENNTKAGTATITVTGKGAYTGTATGSFLIVNEGWAAYEDSYCYYEADGTMRTNDWAGYQGKYYYLGEDGKPMKEGFAGYQDKLYYIKNYNVSKGWVQTDEGWYYFGSDYAAYTKQWLAFSGAYYYFGEDSILVLNGWGEYNGAKYYLGADGKVVVNGWVEDNGAKFYMGKDGQAVTNDWVIVDGNYYFMDSNGNPITNSTIVYGDTRYIFDGNGICTGSEPVS